MFAKNNFLLESIIISVQFLLLSLMLFSGYIAAPVLFAELPAKVAGDIAGIYFEVTAWVLLAGLLLKLLINLYQQNKGFIFWSSVLNFIVVALLLFWLTPKMEQIKLKYPEGISHDAVDWGVFASLHGVYQLAYLSVIVLIAVGIFKQFFRLKKVC